MSTSTELYTTAAEQARAVTEKSVESFKRGAQTFTENANVVAKLPSVDLTTPVQRYFDYLQQTVDKNREFATKWAELVTSFSGTFRGQAESFGTVIKDQTGRVTDTVTDLVTAQAEKAEQIAKDQAAAAEQAEKDIIKEAKKAEREAVKKAHDEARAAYEGLAKAELSDLLAERDLPKSGTVEELIERLVAADTE